MRRKDDDGEVEFKPRHKAVPRGVPITPAHLTIEITICDRIEPLFAFWKHEAELATPLGLFDEVEDANSPEPGTGEHVSSGKGNPGESIVPEK